MSEPKSNFLTEKLLKSVHSNFQCELSFIKTTSLGAPLLTIVLNDGALSNDVPNSARIIFVELVPARNAYQFPHVFARTASCTNEVPGTEIGPVTAGVFKIEFPN